MQYYVSANAPLGGDGSKEKPFKRIGEAASIALPGDQVLVLPGIYREWVSPKNGGTKEAPIVYRSVEPLGAVITGAETVKGWERFRGDVWVKRIGNGFFGDYNPYTTYLSGDWFYSPMPLHTGEIYLNGSSLYETDSLEKVLSPAPYMASWEPENTLFQWYTAQEGDETVLYVNFQGKDPNEETVEINVRRCCFYPKETGKNYITLSGFNVTKAATQWAPPTAYQEGMIGPHWSKGWIIEDCEVSHSKCSGISLGKYLQPYNENKWTLKRLKHGTQTERDAICQAQIEGWTKENIGSHTVRRCHIHHCEQTGIVGHLGGVFSLIEDNHIHHINTKQQLTGAEVAGIKMHAAIDVIFRRNHIHHCTRGLWLDWQAQGTRVTQNLFHDNNPPYSVEPIGNHTLTEDLFVEVSHGPTLIDNNLFLSAYSGKLCTQGVAYVHNLIAGPFVKIGQGTNNQDKYNSPRYTPYHVPHRTEVVGFMTFLHGDDRFYNNIFLNREIPAAYQKLNQDRNMGLNDTAGTFPFDFCPTPEEYFPRFFREGDTLGAEDRSKYYEPLPVYTGGNLFFGGAKPYRAEKNFAVSDADVKIALTERDGSWYLETDLYQKLPALKTGMISSEILGEAFEPEERFENPDGSSILFCEDYSGCSRSCDPTPGPFEAFPESGEKKVY